MKFGKNVFFRQIVCEIGIIFVTLQVEKQPAIFHYGNKYAKSKRHSNGRRKEIVKSWHFHEKQT